MFAAVEGCIIIVDGVKELVELVVAVVDADVVVFIVPDVLVGVVLVVVGHVGKWCRLYTNMYRKYVTDCNVRDIVIEIAPPMKPYPFQPVTCRNGPPHTKIQLRMALTNKNIMLLYIAGNANSPVCAWK